ncbi:MAG: hypothetical protein ACYC0X_17365 [Pirellulaceae bacterium]
MHTQRWFTVVGVLLATLLVPVRSALSCPFCTAVAQTFREEIAAMDAVVIAQLEKLPAPTSDKGGASNEAAPSATFTIIQFLKGETVVGAQKTLTTVFLGDAQRGEKYLVMGIDPPQLVWSTPLKLNARQHQYLLDLMKLPDDEAERLEFFQAYLEDADSMLSADAYDEFARASYDSVKRLKPKMSRQQLLRWIADPNVSPTRKRLYFTMLGVCGTDQDATMLEQRLRSTDPESRSGLDALIACYLTLRGPDGLPLIEELFLKGTGGTASDNYPDVYAAIMALRFHGTEGDVIPRARVLQAFSLVLDNPQMADLVIPDLARWQDWSQLERLIEMFKSANTKTSYVRMPIINYVRTCPLPAAQQALEEFRQIDPEAVKRSMTFFPTLPKESQ